MYESFAQLGSSLGLWIGNIGRCMTFGKVGVKNCTTKKLWNSSKYGMAKGAGAR